MRITDCRYDRDRLRLTVAYRLIAYEARTQTIRECTQLSGDRIRKLYREYVKADPAAAVRRRRGKSPRQMAFFWRTPTHELQAAAFGTVLRECGLLRSARPFYRPDLAEVARVCDAYQAFRSFCPATVITFEHGWYLLQVLARLDEYVLARCPDCRALWIRDNLGLLPDNCVACRSRPPPGMLARD